MIEILKDLSLLIGVDLTWKQPIESPIKNELGDMTHRSDFCLRIKSSKNELQKCARDCSERVHYDDREKIQIRKVCHAGGQLLIVKLISDEVYLGSLMVGPFTYEKENVELGLPHFEEKRMNKIFAIVVEITPLILEKITNKIKRNLPLQRNQKIDQVLTYMEKNFSKNITIQDLSLECHLSSYRLMHLFKKEVNQTIFEYLLCLRMKRASELLKSTSLKVMDISRMVGYENTNFFNLKFKHIFKMTPTDFRKEYYITPNP